MLTTVQPQSNGQDPVDAVASAEAASLLYFSDTEPGIRRKRAGKGFWYIDPQGHKIIDPETLARIRSLAIPPAWTDVWISPAEEGHIQATGRDTRGRKQYRYHPRWTACRDEVKYSSLTAFARALSHLRQRIDEDLGRRGLPRERVLATVVWLLDNAMIRVGNATYARDNNSFGLTTLRDQHVKVEGAKLRFAFRGKSGKEWRLQIMDRRIAKIVKGVQDIPGQHLFQYIDETGERRAIGSQDVNAYIHEAIGGNFTSKHFRTWGGTIRAAELFEQTELPPTKREIARTLNAVIDQVAARLGNTRAVCRSCYIHPLIITAWSEGRLRDEFLALRRRFRRPPTGLAHEEALTLHWLEEAEGKAA